MLMSSFYRRHGAEEIHPLVVPQTTENYLRERIRGMLIWFPSELENDIQLVKRGENYLWLKMNK